MLHNSGVLSKTNSEKPLGMKGPIFIFILVIVSNFCGAQEIEVIVRQEGVDPVTQQLLASLITKKDTTVLTDPVLVSGPVSNAQIQEIPSCLSGDYQCWTLTSDDVLEDYAGTYTIQWQVGAENRSGNIDFHTKNILQTITEGLTLRVDVRLEDQNFGSPRIPKFGAEDKLHVEYQFPFSEYDWGFALKELKICFRRDETDLNPIEKCEYNDTSLIVTQIIFFSFEVKQVIATNQTDGLIDLGFDYTQLDITTLSEASGRFTIEGLPLGLRSRSYYIDLEFYISMFRRGQRNCFQILCPGQPFFPPAQSS